MRYKRLNAMMKSTAEIIALTARKRTHPLWFAAGGFLVGVASVIAWNMESAVPEFLKQEETAIPSRTESAGFPSNSRITVAAQHAGETATVAEIKAPAEGVWAAVHERTGTTLGNVLGAARVTADAKDVSVPLLRKTEPNRAYAVVLYRDDGDGEFSLEKDSVFVDFETGARVVSAFETNP